MSSITIREFVPSDVERVLEIRNSNLEQMIDVDNYPKEVIDKMIKSVTAQIICDLAKQEDYSILVGEKTIEGKPLVVATGGLCVEKTNEASLRLLFVDREHQRKGIGSQMLKSLEDLTREKKITKLTGKSSVPAFDHLYLKRGYVKDSEVFGDMGRVILISKQLSEKN